LKLRYRVRTPIALEWLRRLLSAVREVDKRCLVCLGLIDWNMETPCDHSGFVPSVATPEVDFISVHIEAEKGNVDEVARTLGDLPLRQPLLEEVFPSTFRRRSWQSSLTGPRGIAVG